MHMYSVTITCMGNSPKDVEVKQALGLAARRSEETVMIFFILNTFSLCFLVALMAMFIICWKYCYIDPQSCHEAVISEGWKPGGPYYLCFCH